MDLFQTARNLLENRVEKQRICAIATFKGRVTGIAVNSYSKTHPEQKRLATKVGHSNKQYLHAEVLALLRARKVDSIHVFRLGRNGEWLNATPCTICQLAIKERRISRIFHT
jgi:deoxycytidylate deaminase